MRWERIQDKEWACKSCGAHEPGGRTVRQRTWLGWSGARLTGVVVRLRKGLYSVRQRDLFGWRDLTESTSLSDAKRKVEHVWSGS